MCQKSVAPHFQAPLYAPCRVWGHWALLHDSGLPHLQPSCQKGSGQPLCSIPPINQVLEQPVCRYALWFVDRCSKHINKYPLKSLASDELLKSLRLFCRQMGGCYPDKMIGDRDFKLIGGQVAAALEVIHEDREDNDQSVATSAPSGRKKPKRPA